MGGNIMQQATLIPIEHKVITLSKPYERVIEELEERLGQQADWAALQRVIKEQSTFEQATRLIEQQLGTSGFTLFSKIDVGALLTISGIPTRAAQYALGNPLLAIQMIKHAPEIALYAPLRLAVYENQVGNAVIAYENFTSQLAQYAHPEIAAVSHLVEQKLEALLSELSTVGEQSH
jgi:uncharacterized protein (DUF302 family)